MRRSDRLFDIIQRLRTARGPLTAAALAEALEDAAESVLSKVTAVLPAPLRAELEAAPFYVSPAGAPVPERIDLAAVRNAIRDERKLYIAYLDEKDVATERTIWPIALAYYVQATLIGAWCELRQDYRHFRADRISALAVL